MNAVQEIGDKRRTWRKRHATALSVASALSAGLVYLWIAECKRTASTLSLLFLGGALLHCLLNAQQKITAKHLIVITGCDSGLGYSLALHCNALGATVIAGIFEDDEIASSLKEKGIIVYNLDLTNKKSMVEFTENVKTILSQRNLVLRALVNNAAVMIFGEFEWQTEKQVLQQIAVNLIGTMNITRYLMPTIRANTSRIIVISSHCAKESLPGLSIYGATKAATQAWTNSLRVELEKYSVKVISFIPGGFTNESNIMARQKEHFATMESSMSHEAKNFYGDYFTRYADYISSVSHNGIAKRLTNERIYETFDDALCDVYPSAVYKCESWRYFLYHLLFRVTPTWMRDRLVQNFMRTPSW